MTQTEKMEKVVKELTSAAVESVAVFNAATREEIYRGELETIPQFSETESLTFIGRKGHSLYVYIIAPEFSEPLNMTIDKAA